MNGYGQLIMNYPKITGLSDFKENNKEKVFKEFVNKLAKSEYENIDRNKCRISGKIVKVHCYGITKNDKPFFNAPSVEKGIDNLYVVCKREGEFELLLLSWEEAKKLVTKSRIQYENIKNIMYKEVKLQKGKVIW